MYTNISKHILSFVQKRMLILPIFLQRDFGVGEPPAIQLNAVFWPSTTSRSCGSLIQDGGAKVIISKILDHYFSIQSKLNILSMHFIILFHSFNN